MTGRLANISDTSARIIHRRLKGRIERPSPPLKSYEELIFIAHNKEEVLELRRGLYGLGAVLMFYPYGLGSLEVGAVINVEATLRKLERYFKL